MPDLRIPSDLALTDRRFLPALNDRLRQIHESLVRLGSTGRSQVLLGDLDAGENRICNVASPVDLNDAVTKRWADARYLRTFRSKTETPAAAAAQIEEPAAPALPPTVPPSGFDVVVRQRFDPVSGPLNIAFPVGEVVADTFLEYVFIMVIGFTVSFVDNGTTHTWKYLTRHGVPARAATKTVAKFYVKASNEIELHSIQSFDL